MFCDSLIKECAIAGLNTNKYLYKYSLINSGFSSTSQSIELLISFTTANIYWVDTVFLQFPPSNNTQLAVIRKTYDNGTIYFSTIIEQALIFNTTYDLIIIIKKNPNNSPEANFVTGPQRIFIYVKNYYNNDFIPYSGLLNSVNFDLLMQKETKKDEFNARKESYIILFIFCIIAFGFLVVFVVVKISEFRQRKKTIAFGPLPKINPEDHPLSEKELEKLQTSQKEI